MKRILVVITLVAISVVNVYAQEQNYWKITSTKILYQDKESIVEWKEYVRRVGRVTVKTNITYENWKERGGPTWISKIMQKYDAYSNLIETANYWVNWKLKSNTGWIAITRFKYDKYSNVIEYSTFWENSKLVSHWDSIAKEVRAYVLIDSTWKYLMNYYANYWVDWRLIEDNRGVAEFYWEYDANGKLISVYYYWKNWKVLPYPLMTSKNLDNQKQDTSKKEISINSSSEVLSLEESIKKSSQSISDLKWYIEIYNKSINTYNSLINSVKFKYDDAIAQQKQMKDITVQQSNAAMAKLGLSLSTAATENSNRLEMEYDSTISKLINERDSNISIYSEKINYCNWKIWEIETLILKYEWFIKNDTNLLEKYKSVK